MSAVPPASSGASGVIHSPERVGAESIDLTMEEDDDADGTSSAPPPRPKVTCPALVRRGSVSLSTGDIAWIRCPRPWAVAALSCVYQAGDDPTRWAGDKAAWLADRSDEMARWWRGEWDASLCGAGTDEEVERSPACTVLGQVQFITSAR